MNEEIEKSVENALKQNKIDSPTQTVDPQDPSMDFFSKINDVYTSGAMKGFRKSLFSNPNEVAEQPQYGIDRNLAKEAIDISNYQNRYQKEDGTEGKLSEIIDQYRQEPLSFMGYNDHTFVRDLDPNKKDEDVVQGDDTFSRIAENIRHKMTDDNRKKSFLVPSISADGTPILKEVTGTYSEMKQKGINTLPKYGISNPSDGLLSTAFKAAYNTLSGTDDVAIGAAKLVQDLALYVPQKITGADISTKLDTLHTAILSDSQRNDLIPSDDSNDTWSPEWFTAGISNAMASLVQFGAVGRGVKFGAKGALAVSEVFGKEALAAETKQLALNNISRYGSSAVVGYGYAYNNAIQAGLPEGDAILYGTIVGSLNSLIETKFGGQIDDILVGNNTKKIAKQMLTDLGGDLSQENVKRTIAKKIGDYVGGITAKPAGFLSKSAGEGVEESLQSILEQGAQLAYNSMQDKSTEKGQGKFDIDQFSFTNVVTDGMFGYLSAMPIGVSSNRYTQITKAIADGKADEIRNNIDNLAGAKQINQTAAMKAKDQIDQIELILKDHKKTYNEISGDHSEQIKKNMTAALDRLREVNAYKDIVTAHLSDASLADVPEEAEKVKKVREELDAKAKGIKKVLDQYSDPKFIADENKRIADHVNAVIENNDNTFGLLASLKPYEVKASGKDMEKFITGLKPQDLNNPVVNDPKELKNVLELIKGGAQFSPEVIEAVKRDVAANEYHLDTQVNTADLQPTLKQIGFTDLPALEANDEMRNSVKSSILAKANSTPISQEITDSINAQREAKKKETPDQQAHVGIDAQYDQQLSDLHKVYNESAESFHDRLSNAFLDKSNVGVNIETLHAADESHELKSLLSKEQSDALYTLINKTGKKISLLLFDKDMNHKAGFLNSRNTLFVAGDINKIRLLDNKENLSKLEQYELATLRDNLFHVISHELGHAHFNRYLFNAFKAFEKFKKDGIKTIESEYFRRIANLTMLSYHSLKSDPEFIKGYFNQVMQQYEDGGSKTSDLLNLTREFYAEAFSNPKLQAQLDGIDLNDPRNKAEVTRWYNYSNMPFRKNSLLAEIVKSVQGIFQYFRNILTRTERTLLTEAFAVGSGIEFNKYDLSGTRFDRSRTTSQELSIAAFNGVSIFDTTENLLPEKLQTGIEASLAAHGITVKDKSTFDKTIDGIVREIKGDLNNDLVTNSLKAVHFKNANSTLITWTFRSEDGALTNHRRFLNVYGRLEKLNTNPFNVTSPTTLSKPNQYVAFDDSFGDQYRKERIEILNNFDRAAKENFEGTATLYLDEDHFWELNGKRIYGQVNVNYTFKDGSQAIIGYTPDLSKIRLANLLRTGAYLNVQVHAKNAGSQSYVKRDESGKIVDVKKNDTKEGLDASYKLETLFPQVDYTYTPNSRVSKESIKFANAVDTITADDQTLQADTSKNALMTGIDIFKNNITDQSMVEDFGISFYSPETEISGDDKNKIEYAQKKVYSQARKNLLIDPNMSMDEFRRSIMTIADTGIKSFLLPSLSQESQHLASTLGFESKDVMDKYLFDIAKEIYPMIKENLNAQRDKADFEGLGSSLISKISDGIKIDLENISYGSQDKKQLVSFSEAKDVLLDSARGTASFDEMLENLKTFVDYGYYTGKQADVAAALLDHFTRPRNAASKEAIWLNGAKNSYFSQFGSYKKLDGISFGPSRNDASSAGINHSFAGAYTQNQQMINSLKFAVESKMREVYNQAQIDKVTDFDFEKYFSAKADEHFIASKTQDFINDGLSEMEAKEKAESLLNTKDGKRSTLLRLLASANTNYSSSPELFELRKNDKGDLILAGNSKLEAYNKSADMAKTYYEFMGIDMPPVLYRVFETPKTKRIAQQMINDGASESEVKAFIKENKLTSYYEVGFEAKKNSKEKGVYGHHPFFQLMLQNINFMTHNLNKAVRENKGNVDLQENEFKQIALEMLRVTGDYNSPDFYLDVSGNKKWAYKIKAYSDDLLEQLRFDNNKPSEQFKLFRNSPMFKHNTLLASIENANGKPIEFMLEGMWSLEKGKSGKGYNESTQEEYTYMSLAGFVATADRNNNAQTYYHIDDVPSDKPRNLVYELTRISPELFMDQIGKIISVERDVRLKRVTAKFEQAFDKNGKIKDQKAFESMVSNGAEYKYNKTTDSYEKGWAHNISNYFYNGVSPTEAYNQIEQEAKQFYQELNKKNIRIPLSNQFINGLNKSELSQDEKKMRIENERQRMVHEWQFNQVINRYHLSMALMGDYIFYKPDGFVDLNKRKAGANAPRSKANLKREKINLIPLKDVAMTESLTLPSIQLSNNEWTIDEGANKIGGNRTDAQGYITEQFADELVQSYGNMSGYEKVFKPVAYGVSKQHIEEARPLYLKLSLAVIPDPSKAENADHFTKYPEQKSFAEKIYASGGDIAVFDSGIKVGTPLLNKIEDEKFHHVPFDASLFGLQNNPHKDADEDGSLNGMVQLDIKLGDGNVDAMNEYHKLEAELIAPNVKSFFRNIIDIDRVNQLLKTQLGKQESNRVISEYINENVNVFDNPATEKISENVLSAVLKARVALFEKNGDKLVNMSDLGMQRPEVSAENIAKRAELLNSLNVPVEPQSKELMWLAPRTLNDLRIDQLEKYVEMIQDGTVTTDDKGFLRNVEDNSPIIFPAEILVPDSGAYEVGSRVIATRIPTAKKSNMIPGEVVGFVSPTQGNVVVVGKHGTGVLGFDFDVDGLFVWRDRGGNYPEKLKQMFDIAFNILTVPSNYKDMVSPITIDTMKSIRNEIKQVVKSDGFKYNQFSPQNQIAFKERNSIGKEMITIANVFSSISSLASQYGLMQHGTKMNERNILANGISSNEYKTSYIDSDGNNIAIPDIFSELINASTDNAKEQILYDLNINPDTAKVLMEMLARGVELKYGIFFINQPIIKDYITLQKQQNSSLFQGKEIDAFKSIMTQWENNARSIQSNYEYNPTDQYGNSTRKNVLFKTITLKSDGMYKQVIKSGDVTDFSTDDLKKSLVPVSTVDAIDKQISILEKFKYYNDMSSDTQKAGRLLRLTSNFPKTFNEVNSFLKDIEAADKVFQFEDKIKNDVLLTSVDALNNYKHFFEKNKIFADPDVQKYLETLLTSTKKADKVQRDFYTFLMSGYTGQYDFTTRSITGENIDPYYFVDQSAKIIKAAKDQFIDNQFLKMLAVTIQGKEQDVINKAVEPSIAEVVINREVDEKQIKLIHDAFNALPREVKLTVQGVSMDVKDLQSLIIGHLMFSKGLSYAGRSFVKYLPVSVMKDMENAISNIKRTKASFSLDNPNALMFFDEDKVDYNALAKELLEQYENMDSEKDVLNLNGFVLQFYEQNPSFVPEVSKDVYEFFATSGKHADIALNEIRPDSKYYGAWRIYTLDGSKRVEVDINEMGYDALNFVKKFQFGFKRTDAAGVERFYKRVGTDGTIMMFEQTSVNPFKSVKNFNRLVNNNTQSITKGEVAKDLETAVDREIEAKKTKTLNVPEVLAKLQANKAKAVMVDDLYPTGRVVDAIREGTKTSISVPKASAFGSNSLTKGDLIKIKDGFDYALVRLVKSPLDMNKIIFQALQENPDTAEQTIADRWSTLEDNGNVPIDLNNRINFQFEYAATLFNSGTSESLVHASEDYLSKVNENGVSDELIANDILSNSLATQASDELKTVPTIDYEHSVSDVFFDTLNELGISDSTIATVREYLESTDWAPTNTNKIANQLRSNADDNTISSYNFNAQFTGSTNADNNQKVFAYRFVNYKDQLAAVSKFVDEAWRNAPAPEGKVDFRTGNVYTNYDYHQFLLNDYIRQKDFLDKLKVESRQPGFFDKLTHEQLHELVRKLSNDTGALGNVLKVEYRELMQDLYVRLGNKIQEKVKEKHREAGHDSSMLQNDIEELHVTTRSVFDFPETQLGMQGLGLEIEERNILANMEKQQVGAKLKTLLDNVFQKHYAHQPKNWFQKAWNRKDTVNAAFDWMIEKDQDGNATGQFIARYKQDEQKVTDEIFERIPVNTDDPFGDKKYVIRTKQVYFELKELVRKNPSLLTQAEKTKMKSISTAWDKFEMPYGFYDTLTKEEQLKYGKDVSEMRRMLVKAIVRSEDSDFFKTLKQEIAQSPGTNLADVNQAKIDLYDFVYEKGNDLMSQNAYESYTVQRALMPHLFIDLDEKIERNGLGTVLRNFKSMHETQDDTNEFVNGIHDTDGAEMRGGEKRSFENSSKVPFRSVSRKHLDANGKVKQVFSTDVIRILNTHFSSLIFKKHFDDVIVSMEAVKSMYDNTKTDLGGDFKYVQEFITRYANNKVFGISDDNQNSAAVKIFKLLKTYTVINFLGLNPRSAFVNALNGYSENMKTMMGELGVAEGSLKFKTGFARTFGNAKNNVQGSVVSRLFDGSLLLNKKTLSILEFYGIQTYSQSELEKFNNKFGQFKDAMMLMQRYSEVSIRAIAFTSEFTQEEWDNFELTPDGSIQMKDESKAPSIAKIAEIEHRIGNVHGKYEEMAKRLIHTNFIMDQALLFKGWLIDYYRSRAGKAHIDQHGKQVEGYFRTAVRTKLGYKAYKQGQELTQLETENLRKTAYDAILLTTLTSLAWGLDDKDKNNKFLVNLLNKINSELFLLISPAGLVRMAKQPFAALHTIETAALLVDKIISRNVTIPEKGEAVVKSAARVLPGTVITAPLLKELFKKKKHKQGS